MLLANWLSGAFSGNYSGDFKCYWKDTLSFQQGLDLGRQREEGTEGEGRGGDAERLRRAVGRRRPSYCQTNRRPRGARMSLNIFFNIHKFHEESRWVWVSCWLAELSSVSPAQNQLELIERGVGWREMSSQTEVALSSPSCPPLLQIPT